LLINRLMRRSLGLLVATCLMGGNVGAQQPPAESRARTTSRTISTASPGSTDQASVAPATPSPAVESTPRKRGLLGRILHPLSPASAPPRYKDPKLRGLSLSLQVSPQTVKLSETRQLAIKLALTNEAKKAIELSFPNDQRIEIFLMNSAGVVLTKWSDNHAVTDNPGVVLINPQEHIEYNETISTRELSPNKVFIAEVFFPKYPELRARQKFLTAR
jgi:hypothetical protein